jgi:hypothetical protein
MALSNNGAIPRKPCTISILIISLSGSDFFSRRLYPGLPDCYIFKPKITIWVNFGGSGNEKCL